VAKITLKNGITFECATDQIILDAAKQNGIAIEHSCRTGRCGVCATTVLSGDTVAMSPETSEIGDSHGELMILTCCRAPVADLELGIEDLGEIGKLQTVTLPCRIDNLDMLNEAVLELTLRLPPTANFKFVAGQYINLIGEDGLKRSYSIANSPAKDGKIILHIKCVKNGMMSDYLFNRAKKNDLLRFEGPLGTFSFRKDDSKNVVFLATGTGIAPVKSILEDLQHKNIDKNVIVIWGGRYLGDLYWRTSCISLPHQYIPVLSRELNWLGFRGYVQNALLDLELDLASTTVYACGSEFMIKDASSLLIQNGLPLDRFHSDAFVSSN
jgi:CDP-4-dehydro-6-deoxyglucose reductase